MDNLCHTLAGLALGEAGLKRRTALATATLVIGANLPDVDALSYFWGKLPALGFRRGWTHGILADLVWPFALTGAMLAWDRWVRRRRNPVAEPARARGLLLLAYAAVLSHPLLDLCNTYGVRLLMPFSGRWFYGDALFIVDPWVWLALLAGILLARRAARQRASDPARPARTALGLVGLYVSLMFVSGAGLRYAIGRVAARHGFMDARIMVGPVEANPFRRDVVIELPGAYTKGTVSLLSGRLFASDWESIPRHADLPRARAASVTHEGLTYLSWARFPYYTVGKGCPARHVCLHDARYYPRDWSEVAVPLLGPLSLAPPLSAPEQP
jgi:inner membrane protein